MAEIPQFLYHLTVTPQNYTLAEKNTQILSSVFTITTILFKEKLSFIFLLSQLGTYGQTLLEW